MRRTVATCCAVVLAAGIAGVASANNLNDEYFAAVGSYYHASYEEVFALADEVGVNDVTVAYAIAERAKVSIDKVVELRSDGGSWQEVAADCGLGVGSFYVMVSGKIDSRTFKPIFAKFASKPEFKWAELEFSDQEIVNLVNLKTLSSQYDYSIFDVMAMKDVGSDWPRINQKVKSAKDALIKKYAQR